MSDEPTLEDAVDDLRELLYAASRGLRGNRHPNQRVRDALYAVCADENDEYMQGKWRDLRRAVSEDGK